MRTIKNGLYLVVDPMPGLKLTLPKIKAALDGGTDVLQLWNNWNPAESHISFISEVCKIAQPYRVPVLINEHWDWLQTLPLHGVHFDTVPKEFEHIKEKINRRFITGITCGNDTEQIHWAIENKLDYLSFCSMFPSATSNSCELVKPDVIKQTRALTDIPIYVSGGITFDNIAPLLTLGINGVAVVSGIMKAGDPLHAARKFKQCLGNKASKKTIL